MFGLTCQLVKLKFLIDVSMFFNLSALQQRLKQNSINCILEPIVVQHTYNSNLDPAIYVIITWRVFVSGWSVGADSVTFWYSVCDQRYCWTNGGIVSFFSFQCSFCKTSWCLRQNRCRCMKKKVEYLHDSKICIGQWQYSANVMNGTHICVHFLSYLMEYCMALSGFRYVVFWFVLYCLTGWKVGKVRCQQSR